MVDGARAIDKKCCRRVERRIISGERCSVNIVRDGERGHPVRHFARDSKTLTTRCEYLDLRAAANDR